MTTPMSSPLDGNGVAWACIKCNSPRSEDPCPKCGTALTKPADGWEWPTLPDIDRIRALAREVGYAVGVHGSLERDLDLIAAPWVADAVAPLVLARHIAAGLGGEVVDYQRQDKPCGRWSCNIHTPDWTKMIDLSVMPPLAPSHTAVEPVGELVERLRDIVTEFDNEVADMMSNDGAERADLWVDVDVPIGIVRQADSALTAQAAALVAAESNAERMERNWRTAAALVERHEATIEVQSNKLTAAETEVATLKARVAELEAGLEPFARMFDEWMRDYPDGGEKEEPPAGKHAWGFNGTDLLWGDFIRARRLTHQEKNNG